MLNNKISKFLFFEFKLNIVFFVKDIIAIDI